MFKNYIKIAWRNLKNNRGYSVVNVLGLTLGFVVALFVNLWIYNECSYDDYFNHKERIGSIKQTQIFNGRKDTHNAISISLEETLRKNYKNYFKYIVLSSWNFDSFFKYKETIVSSKGYRIQSDAPELLNLKIQQGVLRGLDDLNSIMISSTLSKKIFKNENPIGKFIKLDAQYMMKVTGVFQDFPQNTSFHNIHYLVPWKHYIAKHPWIKNSVNDWHNNSFQLFVELADNISIENVNKMIVDIKEKALQEINDVEITDSELFFYPMSRWRLYNNFENGMENGGRIDLMMLLGVISFFILFLACVNFINLSTAQSERRAKEVGVKKTIGASRKQLIFQFYIETFLQVLAAILLAFFLFFIFRNSFNQLVGMQIVFPKTSIVFWEILVLVILTVALISGSYSAFFLSKFKPVKVIRGAFIGNKSDFLRKLLVVFQFVISISLIILTLIIYEQMDFVKNRALGYDNSALLQFEADSEPFFGKYKFESLRKRFVESGAVEQVSISNSPVTAVKANVGFMHWKGMSDGFEPNFAWVEIGFEYAKTLKLDIIKGRDFSRDIASDSTAILINESAVEYMGLQEPIGTNIIRDNNLNKNKWKIIGVVKDVVMGFPFNPVKPTLYPFKKQNIGFCVLRLNQKNSVVENLKTLKTVFKEELPDVPFDIEFVDQVHADKFKSIDIVFRLVYLGAGLAIFISCLGLWGLVSFVSENRTKEIGIRKTVGASVFQVWIILCKDFIILVIIASVLAIPISFLIGKYWIEGFKYRIDVSPWLFVIGVITAFVVMLVTISYQVIKTALINPVEILKTE